MQLSHVDFCSLGIAPKVLSVLDRLKFVQPTPIQLKAIPIALEGKDVVGIAQTGTGKTLAFGIPIVQHLGSAEGCALVLVPTRELALQADEMMRKILQPYGLKSVVLIGGASMLRQVDGLKRNPRVFIATPGRLIDHLQQRTLQLKNVNILVLDEADRMFDMGFAPQVKRILQQIPKKRQTLLFSATMPFDIISLATQHMKLPIHVEIAPSGTAAEQVTQELFIVQEDKKKALLRTLLDEYRGSILLFTRTKIKARKTTRSILKMGHRVAEIHSDRSLSQRKQAIEGFKSGRYRVLVATDIAARGIDVKGIELVVNYDLPDDSENYVHRIGRTGRAGHDGHAISFATPDQGGDVGSIERLMKKSLPIRKHPEFSSEEFIRQSRSFGQGRHGRGGGRMSFRHRGKVPRRRH
jgi:ATP-dependent RNA helicase RhlE